MVTVDGTPYHIDATWGDHTSITFQDYFFLASDEKLEYYNFQWSSANGFNAVSTVEKTYEQNLMEKEQEALTALELAEVSFLGDDLANATLLVEALPSDSDEKEGLMTRLQAVESKITAIDLVDVARTSQLRSDYDAANLAVEALAESAKKTELVTELVTILESVGILENLMGDTEYAVEMAEGDKILANAEQAQELIDQLPAGEFKEGLQARLDIVWETVNAEIDLVNQISEATNFVETVEGTMTEEDFNNAQALVSALPDTVYEKAALQTRLDTIHDVVFAYQIAVDAVEEAETLKTMEAVDSARVLVSNVSDQFNRDLLNGRLDTVQAEIQADETLVIEATDAVEVAETTKTQESVDTALVKVALLSEGSVKEDLSNRLQIVQEVINVEAQITEATTAVEDAKSLKTQESLDTARNLVVLLPEGDTKNLLSGELDILQQEINDALTEEEAINKSTDAVVTAETERTQESVDYARTFVSNVQTEEIRVNLMNRLDAVEVEIAEAEVLEQAIIAATQAVELAENKRTQLSVNDAVVLVSDLPDGETKVNLESRLSAVQSEIDAITAQVTEATTAVETAESSETLESINQARLLVDALPVGEDKDNLTLRLDTVEQIVLDRIAEEEALANAILSATNAVVTAESSEVQQDVDDARALVNGLPEGETKTDLNSRLDVVQGDIDTAVALENQIQAASQGVVDAEMLKTQDALDSGRILVNGLPASDTKTDLTARLDSLQDIIDQEALELQIATAISMVEKVESTLLEADLNSAKNLVAELPEGAVKTELENRLTVVETAMNDEDEEVTPEPTDPEEPAEPQPEPAPQPPAPQPTQPTAPTTPEEPTDPGETTVTIEAEVVTVKKEVERTVENNRVIETVRYSKENLEESISGAAKENSRRLVISTRNDEASHESNVTIDKQAVESLRGSSVDVVVDTNSGRFSIPNSVLKQLDEEIEIRLVREESEPVKTRIAEERLLRRVNGAEDVRIVGSPLTIKTSLKDEDFGISVEVNKSELQGYSLQQVKRNIRIFAEHSDSSRRFIDVQVVEVDDKYEFTFETDKFSTFTLVEIGGGDERLAGDNRFGTAIEVSKSNWDTSDFVVLARSDEFVDALAGTPLAIQLEAPLLLTGSRRLNEQTLAEINRLETKTVYILGSTNAISKEVEESLRNRGIDVVRLGGENRYETSVKIAEHLLELTGKDRFEEAFVVNASNFPDALSIAPEAGRRQAPILLARGDAFHTATEGFINSANIENLTAIGGDTVVSKTLAEDYNMERIFGTNRYTTALEVAKTYETASNRVYVATGLNFPDALSAGVVAGINHSSIVLVKEENQSKDLLEFLATRQLTVIGGDAVVNKSIFDR